MNIIHHRRHRVPPSNKGEKTENYVKIEKKDIGDDLAPKQRKSERRRRRDAPNDDDNLNVSKLKTEYFDRFESTLDSEVRHKHRTRLKIGVGENKKNEDEFLKREVKEEEKTKKSSHRAAHHELENSYLVNSSRNRASSAHPRSRSRFQKKEEEKVEHVSSYNSEKNRGEVAEYRSSNDALSYKPLRAILSEKPVFATMAEPKPLIGTEFDIIVRKTIKTDLSPKDNRNDDQFEDKPDDYKARRLIPIHQIKDPQFHTYIPKEQPELEQKKLNVEVMSKHRRSNSESHVKMTKEDRKRSVIVYPSNELKNEQAEIISTNKYRSHRQKNEHINDDVKYGNTKRSRHYEPPELKSVESPSLTPFAPNPFINVGDIISIIPKKEHRGKKPVDDDIIEISPHPRPVVRRRPGPKP